MKSQLWGTVLLAGVALLPGSALASNLTINFDNLPQNTINGGIATSNPAGGAVSLVSTQYQAPDGVTFSDCLTSAEVSGACPSFGGGNPYVVVIESNTGYSTTPPNGYTTPNIIGLGTVTTDPGGSPPPSSATLVTNNAGTSSGVSLIITFSSAASNLTFDAYGNDSTPTGGTFALANITFNGGTSTATNVQLKVACGATCNGIQPDPQSLAAFPNITRLEIFNDTDVNGTAFDNFSFSTASSASVPEPSPLMLMGFGGLLLVMRRALAFKH